MVACALWGAAMIKFKIQEEDDVEEDSGLSSLHLRRAAPSDLSSRRTPQRKAAFPPLNLYLTCLDLTLYMDGECAVHAQIGALGRRAPPAHALRSLALGHIRLPIVPHVSTSAFSTTFRRYLKATRWLHAL